MSSGAPGETREHTQQALRDAMDVAKMPARDYRIYGALLRRADWKTGLIPKQFQPRSLENLTSLCGLMSRTAVADGLNHLEQHGWVIRQRLAPGRGNATFYALDFGADCTCLAAAKREAPTPEAERARRYRARRKASGIRVTLPGEASGIHVTKRPAVTDEFAGQHAVSTEEAVRRGEVEGEASAETYWGWPADSWGAEANE